MAKSEQGKQRLQSAYRSGEVEITMRVVIHGDLADPEAFLKMPPIATPDSDPATKDATDPESKSTNEDEKDEEDEEDEVPDTNEDGAPMRRIIKVERTRSNAAKYLDTLDLELATPVSTQHIRRFFFDRHYPIVGNSTYTKMLKASRDKGLCMSITRVAYNGLIETAPEPVKFGLLRAREHKFWQRKVDAAHEAMRRAGVDVLDVEADAEQDGRPLAYRLGECSFAGLTFRVSEACLIPRPSSETLVEAVKDVRHVLDIGTGCGNLLLAILNRHPNATGVGLDLSPDALAVARANATHLRLGDRARFVEQNMADLDFEDTFDVVVCNPPYLAVEQKVKIDGLDHEPASALFADEDGYAWYRVLQRVVPSVLELNGRLVLECGKGMMDGVKSLFADWDVVEVRKDRQGWDRCLVLKQKPCTVEKKRKLDTE